MSRLDYSSAQSARARLLSVEEAAAYLNVSPRWIRSAVFEQRFATVRLGRCVRIETDELDRYVEANRQPARRELDRVKEVVAIRRRP